mgnify:CR=1 FL=1
MVSSLIEESSDESTIISSQTSTLTRNQGPDNMDDHNDGTLKLGTRTEGVLEDGEEEDDLEDEDDLVREKSKWIEF